MMQRPQLIAVGVIFLGLIFFGVGIYTLARDSIAPVSSANNSIVPAPTVPAATPVKAKSKLAIKREPTPEPSVIPTPEPRKPSSVQWINRDSLYGGNTWKVSLTRDKWFDTGIPYITNDTLNISQYGSQETDPNTLIKVNGNVFNNKEGRQIYYFDRDGFDPKLRDTVKLKLVDGAEPVELTITVIHVNAICTDYNNHKTIHEASISWSDSMVNKTKR